MITQILEYKTRDTVSALTELLHRAQHGRLHGLVFICKTGPRRHRVGITGEYAADPAQALGAAVRLSYRLNLAVTEAEMHAPSADTAPAPFIDEPSR